MLNNWVACIAIEIQCTSTHLEYRRIPNSLPQKIHRAPGELTVQCFRSTVFPICNSRKRHTGIPLHLTLVRQMNNVVQNPTPGTPGYNVLPRHPSQADTRILHNPDRKLSTSTLYGNVLESKEQNVARCSLRRITNITRDGDARHDSHPSTDKRTPRAPTRAAHVGQLTRSAGTSGPFASWAPVWWWWSRRRHRWWWRRVGGGGGSSGGDELDPPSSGRHAGGSTDAEVALGCETSTECRASCRKERIDVARGSNCCFIRVSRRHRRG